MGPLSEAHAAAATIAFAMPLPPPPGFKPRRQLRVDRRRILFSSALAALAATVLMVLVHRAAHTPGEPIKPIPLLGAVLVVLGAASCGAGGEAMRQLALTQLGEPDGPETF
ncbi:MAG: hypothetical protein WAM11_11700 [Cyanobium sp.]|jgi:hypothetical protein